MLYKLPLPEWMEGKKVFSRTGKFSVIVNITLILFFIYQLISELRFIAS